MYLSRRQPIKTLGDILRPRNRPSALERTTSTAYTGVEALNEAFKGQNHQHQRYQGGQRESTSPVERGEIVCRQMDVPPHFGRSLRRLA